MIEGSVDVEGVPSIEFEVDGREWRAVIDTGFNGDLELPYTLRNFVRAKFIGRIRSLLAGGQTIDEDNFLVQFPFDGVVMKAEATFVSQSEILIGTHLLRCHCLEIDFVQRSVRLERENQAEPETTA